MMTAGDADQPPARRLQQAYDRTAVHDCSYTWSAGRGNKTPSILSASGIDAPPIAATLVNASHCP